MAGESIKPDAKNFSCPSCGGAVSLRYPGAAISCVCSFCGTVIDVANNNCRIITEHFNKTSAYTPFVPLGTRGELFGRTWELLGFMVRRDVASGIPWFEYLLFNPYYGYRFLTNSDNHWNFVSVTKEKPKMGGSSHRSFYTTKAYFEDEEYKLFYRGKAEVAYVIGEFYWQVKVGSKVDMSDYVNPPLMLSCEADGKEKVWSVGQYISPEEVEKAFKPQRRLIRPYGIAPNQYTSAAAAAKVLGWLWVLFIAILTGLQFWQLGYNTEVPVLQTQIPFLPNQANTVTYTSPVFSITRPKTGVLVKLRAVVDNSWVWASGELINDETGASYPFSGTCEYYHGYDAGEYWSEGNSSADVFFSCVPAGTYYVNVDWESGDFKNPALRAFDLEVDQAAKMYGNYWLILFALSIAPGIAAWIALTNDQSRWSSSDFSPYGQGGSYS